MNSPFFTFLWSQLLYHLPMLMIALLGMVLALVFWRRCRLACLCALVGYAILFLQSAVWPFITAFCYSHHVERGWSAVEYGQIMAVVGGTGVALAALGQVLVLVAIFAGRRAPAAPPVQPPPL